MGKNENLGFYLINYAKNTVKLTNSSVLVLNEYVSQEIGDVFTSKYNSFDFFICDILRSFGSILKFTVFFLNSAVKRLLQKEKNRATSSLQNASWYGWHHVKLHAGTKFGPYTKIVWNKKSG